MGSYNINGGGIASAYDRKHFGWDTTNAITPTSNTTITLRDYVTTNDHIKIERQSDTIFLENRRRLSYYTSNNNNIWRWECSDPLRPVQSDSMLLIYRNTGYRSFKIQSADGNWNWSKCQNYQYKMEYYSPRRNFFFHDTPNRSNEYGSTFYLQKVPVLNSQCESYSFSEMSYMGVGGDQNTCFDVEYNDVYSPWSNPPIPVNSSSDSLTIEIAGRDEYGDLIINVYFTNITDAKPSKPTGLRASRNAVEPDLAFNPKLIWYKNGEPDMMKYKVYRGVIATPGVEPTSYSYIGETTDTTYIDTYILLSYRGSGSGNCTFLFRNYAYRVTAVDLTSKESVRSDRDSIWGYIDPCAPDAMPEGGELINYTHLTYNLCQNFPNPFNPVTNIRYSIPENSFVELKIYNVLGQEIKTLVNEFKNAGNYMVVFNGSDLPSGIYFYKINYKNVNIVKRMLLIK